MKNPSVMLIIGVVLFSLGGILAIEIKEDFSVPQMALIRSILVALAFRAYFAMEKRTNPFKNLPFSFSAWQIKGAFDRALNTVFFFGAILTAGTANGFLLCNSAPIYLAAYQIVFERRWPTVVEWITILINFFGLYIFLSRGLEAGGLGIVMGILGGLTFAGLIFSHSRVGKEGLSKSGEPYTVGTVLLGNLIAIPLILGVVFLPMIFLSSESYLGEIWNSEIIWKFKWPSMKSWILIVVLAIVQSAIPEMLWAKAMPKVNPLLASFAPTSIAILAPLWTWIYHNEQFLDARTLSGAVMVHLAVIWLAIYQKRRAIKK